MSWVTPRTWTAGEQVSKTYFNDWNGDLAAVGSHQWSTWAPSIHAGSGNGSTADIGGGSAAGQKTKLGRIAVVSFYIDWGTTGLGPWPPLVGGPVLMTLPWAPAGSGMPCGSAYLNAGAGKTWPFTVHVASASEAGFKATRNGTSASAPEWLDTWPLTYSQYGPAIAGGLIVYRTNT